MQIFNSVREAIRDYSNSIVELEKNEKSSVELSTNKISKNEPDNNSHGDTMTTAASIAEEIFRMSFENACSIYLDEKVNKKNFENVYKRMIRMIVENAQKERYDDKTPYINTRKVYNQWTKK